MVVAITMYSIQCRISSRRSFLFVFCPDLGILVVIDRRGAAHTRHSIAPTLNLGHREVDSTRKVKRLYALHNSQLRHGLVSFTGRETRWNQHADRLRDGTNQVLDV